MKRAVVLAVLALGVIVAPASAAGLPTALKLRLQTIESRLPEPGRIDALARKVKQLAQAKGVNLQGSAGTGGGVSPDDDALFNLYQDVQQLQKSVRTLRGEVQELRHMLKQHQKRQQDVFVNLSKRVRALEQKLGLGTGGHAGSSTGDSGSSSKQAEPQQTGRHGKGAARAYNKAFDQLSAGQFDQAAAAFEQFVETYPHSEYTDNAWYWLGSTRYINRDYQAALKALRHVLEDFPNSRKVPGVIYKIGVIRKEQGKIELARKKLEKVIEQYPKSNAADLARKRLDGMNGD